METKKLSLISMICMFVAYSCSVTNVANGALLAEGTTFKTEMIGVAVFFVLATIVVSLLCNISFKIGSTKDPYWKTLFGMKGFILCSFIYAFCQSFWACFDFWQAGQAMYNLMPEGTVLKNLGYCIGLAIILVLTILGGIYGVSGVSKICNLTIPLAIILFIALIVAALNKAGGMEAVLSYVPERSTYNIGMVSQSIFGMWMAGYLGAMDLTVDAKKSSHIVAGAVGFAGFLVLEHFVGAVGWVGTNMQFFGDICASLGGAIFICGNIFVIVAQGNTAPACNYMYANSYSAIFRISRKPVAIVVPLIAGVISFVIMFGPGVNMINNITSVVSILAGPLVAITIAEFYIIKEHTAVMEEKDLPALRPTAFFVLIGGTIFGYIISNFTSVSCTSLMTIIITMAVYVLCRKVLRFS